jgi:cytidine deaminase
MTEVERDIYLESLFDSAIRVRTLPYSQFRVGASPLLAVSGNVYVDCSLMICAERACISAAIVAGEQNFRAIALVADTQSPVAPCGACGQVLAGFNPDVVIYSRILKDLLLRRLSRILKKS